MPSGLKRDLRTDDRGRGRRPHQRRVHARGGARQGLRPGCVAALSRRLPLERGWRYRLIFADGRNPTTDRRRLRLGYGCIGVYRNLTFSYPAYTDGGARPGRPQAARAVTATATPLSRAWRMASSTVTATVT